MIEQILTSTKIIKLNHLSAGELDKLIFYCGGKDSRVAIIHDNRPFIIRDKMINELKEKRKITVLDTVFPDPKVSDIMQMANLLSGEEINILIGIGGGSTLDSAKGVAAIISNGGDLEDYLGDNPSKKIDKRGIKLILIPTTAGTGSEVTKFGVYTSRSGRKYTLNSSYLQADVAVLVSDYTYSLPPAITAATAFDALSHALETIWNKNASLLSDKAATESAIAIMQCIEKAYKNSIKERGEMIESACMAGIAFNMTGTAAVHALSFILSEEWHVPHGVACSFTLENVMMINVNDKATKDKLVYIARILFGNGNEDEMIKKLYDRIIELKKRFNLPINFSDLNICMPESKINELFAKSLNDPKMKNNVIPFDLNMIYGIIKGKIN